MGFAIFDIECAEPTMLKVHPGVELSQSGNSYMSGPGANLEADDRDTLIAYLVDQWGIDHDDTIYRETVESIQEIEREGERWFGVFDDPDCTRMIHKVRASTPIEALDRFASEQGFARYSDLIDQEEHGERWLYYTDDLVLGGPFTNHEVFAAEVNSWRGVDV